MKKSKNITSTSLFFNWIKCSLLTGGWAPILVFGLNIAFYLLGFYQKYRHADVPIHLLGGIAITFFYFKSVKCALNNNILGSPSSVFLNLLLFSLTCVTVVFWEFLEWILQANFHLILQISLEDTLFDMFIGIIGGLLVLGILYLRNISTGISGWK